MNFIFSSAAFLILIAYHIHLIVKVRRSPESTSIGVNNNTRRIWVETIMAEKRDILAVQTLRNLSMASSLLASTAIIVGLAIINVNLNPGGFGNAAQSVQTPGSHDEWLWNAKTMILAALFLSGFFNFTIAIRYYNHTAFMINTPADRDASINPASVSETVNRGAFHYTLGMRAYYLAIPLSLWFFGETLLFAGATILLILLGNMDHIKKQRAPAGNAI